MKYIIYIYLISFLSIKSYSQTFQRQDNESAEAFVKRIYNVEDLSNPVIETKEWDSTKKVILCFVPYERKINDDDNETTIFGYALIPTGFKEYKQVLIDTFPENYGGRQQIETVFFVNVDKDKEREIAITISYRSIHKGAQIYGTYYDTRFYDNPNLLSPPKQLKTFDKLNDKFYCFEGDDNGKHFKCKYKEVSAIRLALKQMGY